MLLLSFLYGTRPVGRVGFIWVFKGLAVLRRFGDASRPALLRVRPYGGEVARKVVNADD